jgi:hypothetical protein
MIRVATCLLLAIAMTCGVAAASGKVKPRPSPYRDTAHGFALTLPPGWMAVEQDTGQGEHEPVFKAASDGRAQFMVVLREKGPSDDAEIARMAEASVEKGFAAARGYQRTSIKVTQLHGPPGGPRRVPAVDLWFVMERDGKKVAVGVRALFLSGVVLTLVVDGGGPRPDATTRKLLESFQPLSASGGR